MKKLGILFLSETCIISEEGANEEEVGRPRKEEEGKGRNREMETIGFCAPKCMDPCEGERRQTWSCYIGAEELMKAYPRTFSRKGIPASEHSWCRGTDVEPLRQWEHREVLTEGCEC